ncbi:zinc knuckle CX2CX4HX4C containing protein [Tanacetum coccineum]
MATRYVQFDTMTANVKVYGECQVTDGEGPGNVDVGSRPTKLIPKKGTVKGLDVGLNSAGVDTSTNNSQSPDVGVNMGQSNAKHVHVSNIQAGQHIDTSGVDKSPDSTHDDVSCDVSLEHAAATNSMNNANSSILMAAMEETSAQFSNTLYDYFVGKRLAFPMVENYVKNAWAKYGFERDILRDGFFIFKFSSHDGMTKVLENGHWLIQMVPTILNVWSANIRLKKEEIKIVLVWVKIHNVPIIAFSEIDLNLITTKLGRPIMLDAYSSDMCLNPLGRNTYARALIEVSSDRALLDSVVVAIPFKYGLGHYLETLDIEYEWKPPRCEKCTFFYHKDEHYPKMVKADIQKPYSVEGLVQKSQGETSNMAKKATPPLDASKDPPTCSPTNSGKSVYHKDDLNVIELRNSFDKLMEDDKVFGVNMENGIDCNSGSNVDANENGGNIHNAKEASTSKPKSPIFDLKDESDKDEVFLPDDDMSKYVSTNGGWFTLDEDDLDCYDGYEAQVYDLPEQMQAFFDHYDIHVNSQIKKLLSHRCRCQDEKRAPSGGGGGGGGPKIEEVD